MFILDEEFQGFSNPTETVISVLQSINEPKIAAAERAAEPTQAFVITTDSDGQLRAHIVLCLVNSGERLTYSWDEGPFAEGQRAEIEGEALDFVESMGFMMDNLGVEKLSAEQKKEVLTELPAFAPSKVEAPGAEALEFDEEEEKPTAAPVMDAELESLISSPENALPLKPVSKPESVLPLKPASKKPPMGATKVRAPERPKAEAVDLSDSEFQRDESEFQDELDSIAKLLDGPEEVSTPKPGAAEIHAMQGVESPVKTLLRWFASF
jgi:hypothetical protein